LNFKKRKLICIGNASDIKTASGTPFYILKYGKKIGLISKAIDFNLSNNKIFKYFWNLKQFLKTRKYGGYQYSKKFLKQFQKKILNDSCKLENQYILSHHPSIPMYPWPKNIFVDFYIDATNLQIFNDYGYGYKIDEKFKLEIIKRERSAYRSAGRIICMCQWAADSVIKDYGINPKKVHVVVGGGNLDEEFIENKKNLFIPKEPSDSAPLVIGFLGKDWYRKGGGFTYEIIRNLNNCGINSVLRIIGSTKGIVPDSKFVEYVGFIDKAKDLDKFIEELNSWHFCALFSKKEASPRSNLESLRLGVPIITHDIGGINSTLSENSYHKLFKPFPSVQEVTKWIISEIKPYSKYYQKRELSIKSSTNITWEKELLKIKKIIKS
tara:strand:+ start:348 stop:1490 length:1143 start_codon:yes stop_codon:yes gene_type:complete